MISGIPHGGCNWKGCKECFPNMKHIWRLVTTSLDEPATIKVWEIIELYSLPLGFDCVECSDGTFIRVDYYTLNVNRTNHLLTEIVHPTYDLVIIK